MTTSIKWGVGGVSGLIFTLILAAIFYPEKTAEAIAGAMRQNRETLAAEEREKGLATAKQIRIKAETEKEKKKISDL